MERERPWAVRLTEGGRGNSGENGNNFISDRTSILVVTSSVNFVLV